MGEGGRDFAHGGQPRAGLELFLLAPVQFLETLAVGDVEDGSHPARLPAALVHQRRLVDEHRKARIVAAPENRLEALRIHRPGHALREAHLILVHHLRRPVRHRRRAPDQLLGRHADHAAERGIDVSDPAFQVVGAQAGHQGILHRHPEGDLLAQRALGGHPATDVAPQRREAPEQAERQGDHGADQQAGQELRGAPDAVDAQRDVGIGQVQVARVRVHALSRPARRARAEHVLVPVDQHDLVVLGEPPRDHLLEDAVHRIGGDHGAQVSVAGIQRDVIVHQDGRLEARRRRGLAVLRRAGLAGALEPQARRRRELVRRGPALVAGCHPRAFAIEPDDADELGMAAPEEVHARPQALAEQAAGGDLVGHQPQVVLVAAELETDRLLDPQGVGDQLRLAFVGLHLPRLAGQPQQQRQDQEHEQHRHQPLQHAAPACRGLGRRGAHAGPRPRASPRRRPAAAGIRESRRIIDLPGHAKSSENLFGYKTQSTEKQE